MLELPFDLEVLKLRDALQPFLEDIVVKKNEKTGELSFVLEFKEEQTEEDALKIKTIVASFLKTYQQPCQSFDFDFKDLQPFVIDTIQTPFPKGIQYLLRFENGFGASVIKNKYSYGSRDELWEVAFIRFADDDETYDVLPPCPKNPRLSEPVGYLTQEGVLQLLKEIRKFEVESNALN